MSNAKEKVQGAKTSAELQFHFIDRDDQRVSLALDVILPEQGGITENEILQAGVDLRSLVAMNLLFTGSRYIPGSHYNFTGPLNIHDGLRAAKYVCLEQLKNLEMDNLANRLTTAGGFEEEMSDGFQDYLEKKEHLAQLVSGNREININTTWNLGDNMIVLWAGVIEELARFATEIQDPDRLARLQKIAAIYLIGRREQTLSAKYSIYGSLKCMILSISDILLSVHHPHVYLLLNERVTDATAIDPSYRYNIQFLTDIASCALTAMDFPLSQELVVSNRQIRVLGSVKPLSSHLGEMLSNSSFIEQVEKLGKKNGIKGEEPQDILEKLLALEGSEEDREIQGLRMRIVQIIDANKDKFRCRVQVADPRTFDRLVKRVIKRVLTFSFLRWFIVHLTREKPPRHFETLYTHLYKTDFGGSPEDYGGEPFGMDSLPLYKLIGKKASRLVLKHLKHLPIGRVGYAGVHALVPILVPVQDGIRGTSFEVQFQIWHPVLAEMYYIASLLLRKNGNLEKAGLTSTILADTSQAVTQIEF